MVTCVCCGHRTRANDRDDFCPVCAWDDRNPTAWFPRIDLCDAQRSFLRTGASDPALADLTRPPRPDEARPPWWHPLDDEPPIVLALIQDAFRDVRLDGGTTLEEAELIDDYALPSRRSTDRPPRGHVEPGPWQDITRAGIERFPWGNFTFHDARGLRYYFPSVATHTLTGPPPGPLESLLFNLTSGLDERAAELDALLTDPQRHAIARFLAYLALARLPTADSYYARHGRDALRTRWGGYLDPDHLGMVLHGSLET